TARRFVENDRKVFAAGSPLSVEEHILQDDGLHSYLSVKFPLRDPEGRISGICGIASDITERKRLEAASQRLAAIVESSDDAIISNDLDGVITSWNKGAERVFGYSAEEILGSSVSVLAVPGRPDEMPDILSQIRLGHVQHYDTLRRRRDGKVIDVAV